MRTAPIIVFLFSILGLSSAYSAQQEFVVSSCKFEASGIEKSDIANFLDSQGKLEMEPITTHPPIFVGQTSIFNNRTKLTVRGTLSGDSFVLSVKIRQGNTNLIQERRSAPLANREIRRNYHAVFESAIAKEIRRREPEIFNIVTSERFPEDTLVVSKLDVSCLVIPKPASWWFW